VAVAAAHARRRGVARVLIVDWDVHHGNGTQDIFFDDADVFYLSTHQWPLYPGTGPAEEIGTGRGRGATLNVPLAAGTGDRSFRRVLEEVLVPAARRFEPELVLVSAGFDAHAADPLGSMLVTTTGFGDMAGVVCELADELCGGRVVACLEGGYNLAALADSVLETVRVFAGERGNDETADTPDVSEAGTAEVIAHVRRLHRL
jgi:acetoin utilization deacetylase AcuC-like enzyme